MFNNTLLAAIYLYMYNNDIWYHINYLKYTHTISLSILSWMNEWMKWNEMKWNEMIKWNDKMNKSINQSIKINQSLLYLQTI